MRRRTILTLPPVLAMASCATIPTTGPVVPVAPASSRSAEQGIGIAPQPPVRQGSPEVILEGFLLAMTSDRPGYPVARQYLTQSASNDWKPESGTVIYDSNNHKPVTTEDSASLNAPWIGSLDEQGRHTPQVGVYKHDFRMIKVDGQWRIGAPPQGLLLAKYLFDRYFSSVVLYFLSADGITLAPELVHLPEMMVNPTSALEGLLAGPSPWLRPAVGTAIPADTRSMVAAVTVANGTADVSLTDQISGLADNQRSQMAAQLMWTMNQFSQVTAVRITVNGQPWALPGDPTGTVRLADVTQFAPIPIDGGTWANPFAARGPVLGQLDERGGGQFRTVDSQFGTAEWGDDVGTMAVGRDESFAAVVSRDGKRLWVGSTSVGRPTKVHEAAGMVRPQVTGTSTVWTLAHGGAAAPVLVKVPPGARAQALAVGGLPAGTVKAFRISPDLSRVAVVLAQKDRAVLGLLRLRDRGEELQIGGWLELPMHSSQGLLTQVTDVGWAESLELLVVGASQADPHLSVYRTLVDGSQVEGLGPSDTSVAIKSISTLPRVLGTTAIMVGDDGALWRFEDRFRWQKVEEGYPAATLPG